MFAEFKNTLRRLKGAIIWWGISLFLYGMFMASLFENIQEMGDAFLVILEAYPPEMLAFFPEIFDILKPVGYLDVYYFGYMTFILGMFTVGAFAKLLVGDEEAGILDLVMAHPLSRSAIFWGRVLGLVAAIGLIMLISWVGWMIPPGPENLTLNGVELFTPYLPLFAVQLLFGGLALLLSMILPAARAAGGLSAGLLIGNYLLTGFANINEDLKPIFDLTPLRYYQGADAINGLDWNWMGGLLLVSVVLALLAWWRFQRRDIRVGGEGTWQLSNLIPKFGKTA